MIPVEAAQLLVEAKRQHTNTFNGVSGYYCNALVTDSRTGNTGSCNCGADEWNARIEKVLHKDLEPIVIDVTCPNCLHTFHKSYY